MPMRCPKCGTANPDGNSFCVSCGSPLAGAAPSAPVTQGDEETVAWTPPTGAPAGPAAAPTPAPGPAPAPPSPVPPAPAGPIPGGTPGGGIAPPVPGAPVSGQFFARGTQSPYYQPPPGGTAPATHRLPRNALIAGAIALVAIAAVGGIVFAATRGHSSTPPAPPGPAVPTAQPTAVPTSAPTSAPTAAPTSQPTPAPSGAPSPGGAQNFGFASATVPAGAAVNTQASTSTYVEIDANDGSGQMWIDVYPPDKLQGVTDTASLISGLLQQDQQNSQMHNANWCKFSNGSANPSQLQDPMMSDSGALKGGQDGVICGTFAPSSGSPFDYVHEYVADFVMDSSGSGEGIAFEAFTTSSNYQTFVQKYEVPLLQTIVWHGVTGGS